MEENIAKLEITKTDKSYQGNGEVPSKDTLKAETKQHIADVSKALDWFGSQLSVRGKMHDHTKLENFDKYYEEFCHWVKDGFDSGDINGWWKIHTEQERHHLKDHIPDDVNLIDIVEMCMDCGCAGLARSGAITPLEEGTLPEGLLVKAFNNTLKLLEESSTIKKGKTDGK